MFLLILDKDPYEASIKVPNRYKHKQLLELMQMLSCVVNFGYKELPTGKEIKKWIEKHPDWIHVYAKTLFNFLLPKLSSETRIKYQCILDLLWVLKCKRTIRVPSASTAIWRYNKEYKLNTNYETNTELPIEDAISEYKKYLKWKEHSYDRRK